MSSWVGTKIWFSSHQEKHFSILSCRVACTSHLLSPLAIIFLDIIDFTPLQLSHEVLARFNGQNNMPCTDRLSAKANGRELDVMQYSALNLTWVDFPTASSKSWTHPTSPTIRVSFLPPLENCGVPPPWLPLQCCCRSRRSSVVEIPMSKRSWTLSQLWIETGSQLFHVHWTSIMMMSYISWVQRHYGICGQKTVR